MSRPRWGDESGSAAFPTLVGVMLLLVGLGAVVYMARVPMVLGEVQTAAAYGARSGSQQSTKPGARAAGESVARAHLAERGVPCVNAQYQVTPGGDGILENGDSVTVVVRCTVHTSDITWISLPASQQIGASFTAPVDEYRGNPEEDE